VTHAQEHEKIRIALSTVSFTFLVNLIARDAGIFKKHGLDVESILIAGPAQTAALAAAELDYNSSLVPGLLLAAKGLPLTVITAAGTLQQLGLCQTCLTLLTPFPHLGR
jgi:ABC-type nitrate/sulfonate/bicarbonate transport system substrate-binding protein